MTLQPVSSIFLCSSLPSWDLANSRPAYSLILSSHLFFCLPVPKGSPSRGGDVKVCVLDINQPSLPTPFTLFLCLFLSYGPFTCISFHKFSRQLSAFSLCSPTLISALLVVSTIYLFLEVSLNDFRDPARLPCAATRVEGGSDPGD